MKNIINQSFEGKKVIVRVDFNVPLDENFNISDDSRIKNSFTNYQQIVK